MLFNLLEEANDDLDRAILQPQGDHRARAAENRSRCSRTKTSSGRPCSLREAATENSCSHPETENEVLRSSSKTISPSHGPLEHVADDDFHKQLVLCVPLYRSRERMSEFKTSSLTMRILNLFLAEAEQKGKSHNFRMYFGPGSDGSSAEN